jgi:hypothetical protein
MKDPFPSSKPSAAPIFLWRSGERIAWGRPLDPPTGVLRDRPELDSSITTTGEHAPCDTYTD